MDGGKKCDESKNSEIEPNEATAEKEVSEDEEEKPSKLPKEGKEDDILSAASKTTKSTKRAKRETKKGDGTRKRRKKAGEDKVNVEDKVKVLNYMKEQNRPYSALNVFDNLHGEVRKAEVQKILDVLVEENQIKSKDFGKFAIYLFNQEKIPMVPKNELDNMDKEIHEYKEKLKNLTNELKEKQKSIN